MDPHTGKLYDLSDPNIPDDVRERLVPVTDEQAALLNQEKAELEKALREYDAILHESPRPKPRSPRKKRAPYYVGEQAHINKSKRRAKNKTARQSRRANRG